MKTNKSTKKLSIITYHSAYNFGSVLQAYATQQALANLGYSAELINYRMIEQKNFYYPLYRTKYGIKTWVKDSIQLPCQTKRIERRERFEKFFSDYFMLTPEISEPEDALAQMSNYDTAISGSDQIWNKHSCELENNDWRYMEPYLLKGFKGRKISYASSIRNMTDSELRNILPELCNFDALAFRESDSSNKIESLINRHVETVLDPTFLLKKNEWIESLKLEKKNDEKFILAYFLCGLNQLIEILPNLSKLAQKLNCKVKLVSPFAYVPYFNKRIEYHPEFGPLEFLNALHNAEVVVTDSYHGTVLSVNFGKAFYSICRSDVPDNRKTDILARLGLLNRTVDDIKKVPELEWPEIDYMAIYEKIDSMRLHSLNYLKTAIEG